MMAALDRIQQLEQQGMNESQIIETLRQEKVSPKEIYEALSQSKIKTAVGQYNQQPPAPGQRPEPRPQEAMQPSMMAQPQPIQSYQSEQSSPTQDQSPQEYYQPMTEQYAQPQYEGYYPEYQSQGQVDVETMNDIAAQIVDEKLVTIERELARVTKMRENLTEELSAFNERITRIENVFNELQVAILKKMGTYGEDLNTIAKEMRATQENFAKMINPVLDAHDNTSSKKTRKHAHKNTTKKSHSKKDNFEDYLR